MVKLRCRAVQNAIAVVKMLGLGLISVSQIVLSTMEVRSLFGLRG